MEDNTDLKEIIAALNSYFADQEASLRLNGQQVVEWLRETKDPVQTTKLCLADVLPEDKTAYLALFELVRLAWNALPAEDRGGKADVLPGPVEMKMAEKMREEAMSNIDLNDYEFQKDLDAALKNFQEQWIDKPLPDYENKTPRELVREERLSLNHPEPDKWTLSISAPRFGNLKEDRANALLYAGNEAHKRGDLLQAEEYCRQLIHEYDYMYQAWGNLGLILSAQGRKHEAIQALEKALEIEPEYQLARSNLHAIEKLSVEELRRQQNFISASIFVIGIKDKAFSELEQVIGSGDVENTPAVRDVKAILSWLEEHSRIDLDAGQRNLPHKILWEINALLADPVPVDMTLEDDDGKEYQDQRTEQHQFQAIDDTLSMLETLGIVTIENNQLITSRENARKFQNLTFFEQYVEILWDYFMENPWLPPELDSADEEEAAEMGLFVGAMAQVVKKIVPRRLGKLLSHTEQDQWMREKALINEFAELFSEALHEITNGEVSQEDGEMVVMMYLIEQRLVWDRLEWFGLTESRWRENYEGMSGVLESVRPTDLGKLALPVLAMDVSGGSTVEKKYAVGRNEPCPCGAVRPDGKPVKYKKCHGR